MSSINNNTNTKSKGKDNKAMNKFYGRKPAEAKPAEAKPAEAKPAEAKPAEAKPAEAKPAEANSAEAKPAEAKPAEANSAEAKPAEAKPAEAKPAEAKPAEANSAEAKPLDTDTSRMIQTMLQNQEKLMQQLQQQQQMIAMLQNHSNPHQQTRIPEQPITVHSPVATKTHTASFQKHVAPQVIAPFELMLEEDCPAGFQCPNSKNAEHCSKNHQHLGTTIKKGSPLPKFFCKHERPWEKKRCIDSHCFFAHLSGRCKFIEKCKTAKIAADKLKAEQVSN